MKIARYELKVVYKKELILMMEDDVDSEDLLKIFLETQLKEEKNRVNYLELLLKKCQKKAVRSSVKVVKSIVRQVKNVWQLMKMYDAQSVNTCVKLAGFVN